MRQYLCEHQYRIIKEDMVLEDGKFYPMMKVVNQESETYDITELQYGKLLLKEKNSVLKLFLEKEQKTKERILEKLSEEEGEQIIQRKKELTDEIAQIKECLEFMKEGKHMLCREIIDVIESTYPKSAALSWDNVGLLVGRMEKEVKKIYVALDVTEEIIEASIKEQADMIITHHPLIFSPLKRITDDQFIGKRVVDLLQHDISCYAMHTNYDVLGMAELSGRKIGLKQETPLEVTMPEEAGRNRQR